MPIATLDVALESFAVSAARIIDPLEAFLSTFAVAGSRHKASR